MARETSNIGSNTMPRKGELYELRNGLLSQFAFERKEATQKVIAAMTVGKDVSSLFTDVLKNIATHDIVQKKLVYLYLINYAQSHPDLCILAVNTFVQDSQDSKPLIRALAIRTMGCIRVTKVLDYLLEPLKKTLMDDSPYVRKTAAICVLKFYTLDPRLCIECGFLKTLQQLLHDSTPLVVANAIAALLDINELNHELDLLRIDNSILPHLLNSLNECTEWGRISILRAVSKYYTTDPAINDHICERIIPQFQHANSSVVLSALEIVFNRLDRLSSDKRAVFIKKICSSLISLTSAEPEVQFVALKNIALIIQKEPDLIRAHYKSFYCKYTDPGYLKVEKLRIMIKFTEEENVEQILAELKEYLAEVDMEFVKMAIKAIGKIALKIEFANSNCVDILLSIIEAGNVYIVGEAVIALKDILRIYNEKFEAIAPQICLMVGELDDDEAKCAYMWIVGEYADLVNNAAKVMYGIISNFRDEDYRVQLYVLTAAMKIFLRQPNTISNMLGPLFEKATKECDNPDVRDLAYVYWRLISQNKDDAKQIVMANKPKFFLKEEEVSPKLLEILLCQLGTLASVFYLVPESFCEYSDKIYLKDDALNYKIKFSNTNVENLLVFESESEQSESQKSTLPSHDLLDIFASTHINNDTLKIRKLGDISSLILPASN